MKEKILKEIMKENNLLNKPYTVSPCEVGGICNKYITAELNIKLTKPFTEYRSYNNDDIIIMISSGLIVVTYSTKLPGPTCNRFDLYPII